MTDTIAKAQAVLASATPGPWLPEDSTSVGALVVDRANGFIAKARGPNRDAIVLAVNIAGPLLSLLAEARKLNLNACRRADCGVPACDLARTIEAADAAIAAALPRGER